MAGKGSGAPPGGAYNPYLVKTEKTETEKIYLMTETSDTMKCAQEKLFPLTRQKPTKLKAMFSAPRGVTPNRRNLNFYRGLITDIGSYEVKSETSFGPSVALEKIWMKKGQIHPSIKEAHMVYAGRNLLFAKVNAKLVLVFDTAPLNNNNDMRVCLVTSRARWFAANLIRFPTSPQVMAAQLIRNHARIYSEEDKDKHADEAAAYQSSVKRLLLFCPGMERALVPEGHMLIENHMRMSWYRIRKRVLERMYEEAQKVQLNAEHAMKFMKNMPFGIKTIPDLLREIKDQMEICDALWNREKDGEIELSDGPDVEEEEEEGDMEFGDSMRGQVQNDQRAAPSHGLMQQQQQYHHLLPGSSLTLPPGASRMNQLYNHTLEQRNKQTSTLASLLDPQTMRPSPSGSAPRGGRGSTLPQMTPISTSAGRGGVKMQMRRDVLMDTPSVLPSTSANLTRRGAISREAIPLQQSAPPQTNLPSVSHSIPMQRNVQPPPSAAPPTAPPPSTTHAVPTAPPPTPPLTAPPTAPPTASPTASPTAPATAAPTAPPPTTPHAIPSGLPQLQSTTRRVRSSSHCSSPRLMVVGSDGEMKPIPTVVYVERTENGLVQVPAPTPTPEIVMSIPSTGGRRGRSLSVGKRRMSLPRQQLKRRRADYDGSSEDSDEEEKRLQAKERRVARDKEKKKEERERMEKEEREQREKEEREEEECRKKEEEVKKKEEEERRKKEEEEKKQREEEERKKKEEDDRKKKEEDDRKKKEEDDRKKREEEEKKQREEEDRKKKEEEDRLEMDKLRKEHELKMEAERKKKEEEDAAKEAEKARVEEKNENEVEEGEEETRVLAEDSSDESEKEEGMESEDEVVAESVLAQSDNEEMEEDREKETQQESGVRDSRPSFVAPTEEVDSDLEVIYQGKGEQRPMSREYCEIVSEVVKVKKELDETVDNEVLILDQKKGTRSLPSKLGTRSDKRRSFDQSIKVDNVKKEDENEMEKEKEGTLGDACNQPVPTTPLQTVKREEEEPKREANSENTGLTEVKSEVKEEEEEEEVENENEDEQENGAMVTMIERRNGDDEERIEDTLNRSGELDFLTAGEDEERERNRNVLEAMTQEESSEIPFIPANSDAVSAVTPLPPIEESPMDKTTQSSPTQTAPPPIEEKEDEMEIERATVAIIGDESEVRMSTPSPRPPPISLSSQSGNTGCVENVSRLQTRLSAQQIEMINTADSLCMPYVKGFQRRELKDTEKETEKTDEKEKEGEVEVIRELPPFETDPQVLKFHSMRGIAADLSGDRRCATRNEEVDSCSKALVFTNRPLYKGERVTLRVIETCAAWKGRIRLGLTTKNPLSYASRNEIPKFRETETDHANMSYFYDSGAMNNVKEGSELEVQLTEEGDRINYWFDGVSMGVMGCGLQTARPMWLILDIYGYVKGIEIVHSTFPPQESSGNVIKPGNQMALVLKTETNEESMASENMVMKKEEVTEEGQEGMEKETNETETVPTEKKSGEEEEEERDGEKGEEETAVEGDSVVEETIEEEENSGKRMREEEKKTVDGEGLEEEEEEPPMKKMRIEGESSEEAENGKRNEETKEKDVLDTVMEEKESEEPAVESVEGRDEGEEKSDGDEMATIDENGMKEKEEKGEEGNKTDEEEEMEKAEEEEKVKDIEEVKEQEEDVSGVTEDGDAREEVVNENGNVKEGDEEKEEESMDELIDPREIEEESLVVQKSTEAEEEGKETEIGTPVESTEEEERMEMREELPVVPPLPLRRRSLFGTGCLPFDRTLEAKIAHGTEDEEEEEKMEVDEEEEVVPLRRRSLFGPGSISFNHLLNHMHDKE